MINRIQFPPLALEPVETYQASHSVLRQDTAGGLKHVLFSPLHYEKNYAYPLFVWLHSAGRDETELRRIMPLLNMRNYVAIGPRGAATADSGDGGYDWPDTLHDAARAEEDVLDSIALARERRNIATSRVFLAGFQTGGAMALRIALRRPELFAGALSIGGQFPQGNQPLAKLDQLRRLPLLVAQGRDSQRYPVDQACADLRLAHSAGLSISLRQYPCGDELTTQMLHDMDVWMMEIVTGVKLSADENSLPPNTN